MIPLMKNTFLNEFKTRQALAEFILRTGRLSMGEMCFKFERLFAKWQGRKEAALLNRGGSANLAILHP
jgi:CDP-4-dehydro-6-deoxyglucose reductase, E1